MSLLRLAPRGGGGLCSHAMRAHKIPERRRHRRHQPKEVPAKIAKRWPQLEKLLHVTGPIM